MRSFSFGPLRPLRGPGSSIADADHTVVEASCRSCAGGRHADHPLRAAPSLRGAFSHPGLDESFGLKPAKRCVQSAYRTSSACRLHNRFTHSDAVGVLAQCGCRCDQKVFEFAKHRYNYNVILIRGLVNKKRKGGVQVTRTGQCANRTVRRRCFSMFRSDWRTRTPTAPLEPRGRMTPHLVT